MSVFQNAFDWFAGYVVASLADDLGMLVSGPFDASIHDQGIEPQAAGLPLDFDAFAWVTGVSDGGMGPMPAEVPLGPAFAEAVPVPQVAPAVPLHDLSGPSPADAWLTGHEWSGSISSGTIDPTGQGNDVICYDGEVLNLPF
jgi:hypothetical protein